MGYVALRNTVTTHMKSIVQKGFTVIELLVVTAIIVIVTALVLSNHAKFGSIVVLERLAYQVAFRQVHP